MFIEFSHPDNSGTKVLLNTNNIISVAEPDAAEKVTVLLVSGDAYHLNETYTEVKALLTGATNGN